MDDNSTGTDTADPKLLFKAECFYRSVINEETTEAIAHKFGLNKSAVQNIIARFGRRLNHPIFEGNSRPLVFPGGRLAQSIREFRAAKEDYLARLERLMSGYSLGEIPEEFSVLLPNAPETAYQAPNWTPAAEALLGTASDENVAKLLGFKHRAVRARRLELRIKSFGGGGLDYLAKQPPTKALT